MGFSYDEFRIAADWSRSACSVSNWGYGWVGTSQWEMDCFWPVFDSLGSEKMTRSTKIPDCPCPISRRLSSRRHAAQRNRSRNCRRNWLKTIPAGSIVGSKRECQSTERLFRSSHSEGPSKKLRQVGHQIRHNSYGACSSHSSIRKSRPNSVGMDCDNPKTSASKSTEGNSEYLRCRSMSLVWVRRIGLRELTEEQTRELSVMRMPSYLYSLLRNGGWNSFASANACTPFAALGLGPKCCFRVREQSVSGEASSVKVIRKKATSTGWDSLPNHLREHIVGLGKVRRCWKRQQSLPSETISKKVISKKPSTTTWDSLPNDLQENVLQRVDFMSKDWRKFIEGEAFRQSRVGISEGEFTAVNYYIQNNSWRCSGYDLHSKSWRFLPPVSYLPPPNAELFKEYSVCGHGGLMCAEISKLPKKGELVVFNRLTGETRALPPLLHPRNPVLVHISVDSAKKSYNVIVAGSSSASDEHLSREVEVFDSSTSKCKEVCDLRGPAFGVDEHQAGVCLNGKLFRISFLGDTCSIGDLIRHHPENGVRFLESGGRFVVAFDVENRPWLQDLATPIPFSSYSNTLQLVESDGKLFVCSEKEPDQSVDHCIDELEFPNPKAGVSTCRWRNGVKAMKSGGRGLLRYLALPLCMAIAPNGARAEDQSMDSLRSVWTLNAWETPDFAKKAAVTLLVGLTMVGARAAWRLFRGRQSRGDRFGIDEWLQISDMRDLIIFAPIPA